MYDHNPFLQRILEEILRSEEKENHTQTKKGRKINDAMTLVKQKKVSRNS